MTGVAEIALEADDVQAAEAFYREVIGLPLASRDGERVWLAAGPATRIGLWPRGPMEFGDRGGRHVHFALAVNRDGLAELAARIRGHGVEVRGPVEHDGGDRSIYFTDPCGNVVEAWDYVDTHDRGIPGDRHED